LWQNGSIVAHGPFSPLRDIPHLKNRFSRVWPLYKTIHVISDTCLILSHYTKATPHSDQRTPTMIRAHSSCDREDATINILIAKPPTTTTPVTRIAYIISGYTNLHPRSAGGHQGTVRRTFFHLQAYLGLMPFTNYLHNSNIKEHRPADRHAGR
jgi:hypothetical protein